MPQVDLGTTNKYRCGSLLGACWRDKISKKKKRVGPRACGSSFHPSGQWILLSHVRPGQNSANEHQKGSLFFSLTHSTPPRSSSSGACTQQQQQQQQESGDVPKQLVNLAEKCLARHTPSSGYPRVRGATTTTTSIKKASRDFYFILQ